MKRPVWRDQAYVHSWERGVAHARMHGFRLEVAALRGGGTRALIERKRKSDGGWEQVAYERWQDQSDITLLEAREWCERIAANRSAGA